MKLKLLRYALLVILSLGTGTVFAQSRLVTGVVTEKVGNSSETLIGVNINVVNAQNRSLGGAITDIDGNYRVQIPDNENNLSLVYSYMGMKSVKIAYTGQTTQNVRMESSDVTMEEVTVTARRVVRNDMGISQKEAVSATQRVKMDDIIADRPVVSIEEALQGQLGGVDIVLGGDPGTRSAIRIRGASTLNASSEPLIVIDGVPYSTDIDEDFDFSTANNEDLGALLNISPADIDEIEVLKDASATAIWGTKGANGVLMIKTKRGSAGKTRFTFNSKFSMRTEPETIPMLNGEQYTALMQEAIWNSANYIGMGNPTNKYLRMLYDTPEIGNNPNWKYYDEYNQDTDWLDEVRRNALIADNSFSMSGGGDKATYRFSLGYLSDQGTTIGTSSSRLNTSLNISYNFSDNLRFGADFSYSQTDRDAPFADNARSMAFSKMPNKSPYYLDENGNRTSEYFSYQTEDFEGNYKKKGQYNPVAMVKESFNRSIQREPKIIFRVNYDILPELKYSAWVSLNMRTTKNRKFLPQVVTGVVWTDSSANRSTDATSDRMELKTENKLIFSKNWNEAHNLIVTGVFRTNQSQNSNYSSTTSGNASPGLSDPIVGSDATGKGSSSSEIRSVQGTGLLNYTFLDRYVFQGSMTIEGNSSMGRSNRTGYFPSGGFSWNAQEEPFLEGTRGWLDEAKFRVGVGQTGRAPSGASLYLGAYASNGEYMDMPAIHPTRIQLDNLKWETATEYNFGLDFGFFDNRLRFTFDYYEKYVNDLLQSNMSVPSSTGYATIKHYNSGKLHNKGMEFRTDVVFYEKNDWRVNGHLNISRNINEVTELPINMQQEVYTLNNGNYAILVEEGRPLGSFYGYRYKGVYKDTDATYARDAEGNVMNDVNGKPIVMKNHTAQVCPGDAIYEDINYDGVINEYDIVYLGNYMPIITGGAGITVKYKRCSLTSLFHYRLGQKIINSARMNNESMYGPRNQSTATLRRWKNEGDVTDIPRALFSEGYNYLGSDRFVEDASYLRLKSLSFNYAIPKKFCTQIGINSLSVFVTAENLFTWTDYTGQDPEVSIPNKATSLAMDGATTPISKKFSCGFNLSF